MPIELLPTGIFLLGALVAALAGTRAAAVAALLVPLLAGLCSLAVLTPGATASWTVMAYTLQPVRVDQLSLVMVGLFHVAALIAAVYTLQVRDRLQHAALMLYIAGGIGAVLAGDLISLFIFFELIGLSGTLLVLAARKPDSTSAAVRYLVFQITAGVTLLTGILVLGTATGDWSFGHIGLAAPGGWLILLAFGIKSGFPLLHNWIPDAYPRASTAGLAVLAVVTTKVGVYGLARGFAGEGVLVGIGAVMALWPLFYTLVENDLRRVVAYSMMVQIGLMVAAVGVGSALALDGVAMHIVMDVLFKMVLFMAMGAVALRVGTTRGERLGGLWRAMPLTTICVAVAVAANVALPLTGGFISKKVLLAGIEHGDVPAALWLLLVSTSAMGILYAGLRILWQGFLRPAGGERGGVREAPWPMAAAMVMAAGLLVLTGIFPALTDVLRPHGSDYSPMYPAKVADHVQMLLFTVLAYALLARAGLGLPETGPGTWLDADWLYRRGLPVVASGVLAVLARIRDSGLSMLGGILRLTVGDGRVVATLGRTWPTGSMALWVAILLAALLVFGIGD
ncbi:MAG: proton-conducting transporter membrane subunit [Gammaproteobacteria bacterium]|nr:proton-conducting transporter membrane subunit [Gammaproteobacteria bacterium]